MNSIKFSHRYKKMPHGVEFLETWIKGIAIVDFFNLSEAEIKWDTETVSGEFYPLPKTKLIQIQLWSETIDGGKEWNTLRRHTEEKYQYYRQLVGQQVEIKIDPTYQSKSVSLTTGIRGSGLPTIRKDSAMPPRSD